MGVYYTHWKTVDGKRRLIRLYMAWRNIHTRVRGHTTDGTGRRAWKGLPVGWPSFRAFREWAIAHGYRRGLVLDRKRSKEGYTADNCQWIAAAQNAARAAMQHKERCKCFWCKQKRSRK